VTIKPIRTIKNEPDALDDASWNRISSGSENIFPLKDGAINYSRTSLSEVNAGAMEGRRAGDTSQADGISSSIRVNQLPSGLSSSSSIHYRAK